MAYDFKNITILIAEDNKPMLSLLKSVLQSFGVTNIISALNGDDAFQKFCSKNPDLVITDWMMEPCDGVELVRKIRNNKKSPNQYVPIILMTGFTEKKRVINARDTGITEFLAKPFNARDLYKRIHRIIEQPRQFIRCESFFGPDRRRKSSKSYDGIKRRKSDQVENSQNKKNTTDIKVTDIDFR